MWKSFCWSCSRCNELLFRSPDFNFYHESLSWGRLCVLLAATNSSTSAAGGDPAAAYTVPCQQQLIQNSSARRADVLLFCSVFVLFFAQSFLDLTILKKSAIYRQMFLINLKNNHRVSHPPDPLTVWAFPETGGLCHSLWNNTGPRLLTVKLIHVTSKSAKPKQHVAQQTLGKKSVSCRIYDGLDKWFFTLGIKLMSSNYTSFNLTARICVSFRLAPTSAVRLHLWTSMETV